MSAHEAPRPINQKLLSPGTIVLLVLTGIGLCFAGWRFIFGIGSVTNLDHQHPWGIWIAIDVATGVALAAGGFMTAALAHIFHREHYHAVVRPALLTAMLGYTFVGMGLLVDLGRFYNIWHPAVPSMWSGHSVLFEVGMCVMCYITVLYIEFSPIVFERFMKEDRYPRLRVISQRLHKVVNKIMFLFVIAGVVLSCLHQSSLGNLMVIAPSKMHDLWDTPILALLFLLSAFAVGFPMVIFESMVAAKSFKLKPEMHILTPLARYVPVFLGIYLAFKIGDLAVRDKLHLIAEGSPQATMFMIEIVFGVIAPFALLLSPRIRRSQNGLFATSLMVVLGVALNRINVFLVAYAPLYPQKTYFPSIGEVAVTVGLISLLIFCYRVLANYFPVISHGGPEDALESTGQRSGGHRTSVAAVSIILLIAATPAMGQTPAPEASPEAPPSAVTSPHGDAVPATEDACLACHSCLKPTAETPCLKACLRSSPMQIAEKFKSKHGPKVVILDELVNRYLPVPFDHEGHAKMANMAHGCDTCHHYTPEGLEHPACNTCHEANARRADMRKPGLKGAYHRQCMSCHREWSGNTQCGACHVEKTNIGKDVDGEIMPTVDDLMGRMHPPIPEPEFRIYKTKLESQPRAEVLFRHKEHIERYDLACAECHREDNCQHCHSQGTPEPRVRTLADHHRPCDQCHTDVDPKREGVKCETCHYDPLTGPPRPFEHRVADLPMMRFHKGNSCRDCHVTLPFAKLDQNCGTCHEDWSQDTFDHRITGQILDDNHSENDCTDCHIDGNYLAKPMCTECHDADDDPSIAFPKYRPGPRV